MLVEPPIGNDRLTQPLFRALNRPIGWRPVWGVTVTFIASVLTAGLSPILAWPKRFRDVVSLEKQQMEVLCDWLEEHGDQAASDQLLQAVTEVRFRNELWGASIVCWGTAALLVLSALPYFPEPIVAIKSLVFGYRREAFYTTPPHQMVGLTQLLLAIACGMHWFQVRQHAKKMAGCVAVLNRNLDAKRTSPIAMPALGAGFRPLWMVGMVLMVLAGAVWGVPLMMAGAVHKRYITVVSDQTRAQLAEQLQTLSGVEPDISTPASIVTNAAMCRVPSCRAPVPAGAKFCPRCGSATGRPVNLTA
jgi:hypothetical protein